MTTKWQWDSTCEGKAKVESKQTSAQKKTILSESLVEFAAITAYHGN